ncbi:polysaccharide deacetylase [Bacillus methanolicus PB1]|uniref:Polysaccharide deacetylase n=1 Tax=Bacillus methanolicus PB1 TaxID=997296 RepID=I3DWZ7_BACMT|nr:polysaccharide deacetylase family protein [Bacillus methanolicus]EIJ78768.1 polysaccharide deacetylase [Bacillus methanolicus PB1]
MFKKITRLVLLSLVCVFLFGNLAEAATYTVQPGDTLWKIASKYGTTVEKLVNLNKLTYTAIKPGEKLEVPASSTYKVISGDTFYKISVKLGVSMSELKLANPQIKDPARIFPGQVVNIPDKTQTRMIYMGNSSKKRIALTFDDGPEDIYTPQILEILRQKGVKATFFVVGQQAKAFPELLKQIYKEGHVIGNHSWDHGKLGNFTESQLINDVESTSVEIEKITGYKPNLFRPPYGFLKDEQAEKLYNLGYRTIMWTIDTIDWSGASSEEILSRVHRNVVPGGIVLQHNFRVPGKLDGTVEALPQMIDELRAQGYEFVTVNELIGK